MGIADQFQKVWIFFANDGFIAVLKEVATSFMPLVEGNSIAGHEAAHNLAKWGSACSQQEMKMVWD